MRKILLALVLLVALGAVSYLQLARDQEDDLALTRRGFSRGAQAVDSLKGLIDDLRTEATRGREELDSLINLKSEEYGQIIDSLTTALSEGAEKITDLESQLADAVDQQQASIEKSKQQSTETKHREIISYYKKAVDQLPADLSEYERRVAVNEIRSETQKRFAISEGELNRLREKFEVTY